MNFSCHNLATISEFLLFIEYGSISIYQLRYATTYKMSKNSQVNS